jgi:hypothetical protein
VETRKWHTLFTSDELEKERQRLVQYGLAKEPRLTDLADAPRVLR